MKGGCRWNQSGESLLSGTSWSDGATGLMMMPGTSPEMGLYVNTQEAEGAAAGEDCMSTLRLEKVKLWKACYGAED
jgi:hypothetical protein